MNMMRIWIAILILLLADVTQAADEKAALTLFQHSCIKCHGKDGTIKGKVNLLEIGTVADLTSNPELLQTIIAVLDTGKMPPGKEAVLKPNARTAVVKVLRGLLAVSTANEFAPTPVRRMNRFQYNNAVQDLFGLKVVVFSLPERTIREGEVYFRPDSGKMPEQVRVGCRPLGKSQMIESRIVGVGPFPQDLRAENGFDNRGDHLSLSPLLMETFLKLSCGIVESPTFNPNTVGVWQAMFAPPAEELDLEKEVGWRLHSLLTRAFRRPVEEKLAQKYSRHVLSQIKAGKSFTASMKEAASAVLASPRFLYLYDRPSRDGELESLDGFELASRLSFFLWGSIPDNELLQLAGSGRLIESQVLTQQVDRMLMDRRIKRFCESFPSQWLQLDRIISSVPDEKIYADFYYAAPNYRTSMDMMIEPLLLFETILVENRSILELIDSDFSYRSVRLRRWYGEDVGDKLGGPAMLTFNRVPVTDRRQGGVITTAAVMTMTSGLAETKPITRGAWIAGVIFNDPSQPPPANVPPLDDAEERNKNLTLRERFAVHRQREDCAGCHSKLDPLGFALENFDPVGRWRNQYENGRKVDSSGVLFRKHKFGNVVEFKNAILAEKDRFARALAGHVLSFALGRKLTAADASVLDRVAARTGAANYSLRTLIHEVTQSAPFVSKSGQRTTATTNTKKTGRKKPR